MWDDLTINYVDQGKCICSSCIWSQSIDLFYELGHALAFPFKRLKIRNWNSTTFVRVSVDGTLIFRLYCIQTYLNIRQCNFSLWSMFQGFRWIMWGLKSSTYNSYFLLIDNSDRSYGFEEVLSFVLLMQG